MTPKFWLLILFMIGVFAFDLTVPLGVAAGLPFVVATLFAYWISDNQRMTLNIAGLSTILILLGLVFSSGDVFDWRVVFNRGFSILGVWSVVLVTLVSVQRNAYSMRAANTSTDFFVDDSTENFEVAPLSLDVLIDNIRASNILPDSEVDTIKRENAGIDPSGLIRILVDDGVLNAFQATRIYHGQTSRLVFGDCVVEDLIGRGGVGVIYRARRRGSNQLVAIKQIQEGKLTTRAIHRFKREISASLMLDHENFVKTVESFRDSNNPYMIMEHVSGDDIYEMVYQHGKIDARKALELTRQVANGMAYAHSQGVIHRDLKPSNLIVIETGDVKILDLGLAKIQNFRQPDLELESEFTKVGFVCGSTDFMAPEQAANFRAADHRSDIYSLGCTLFFMLSGRLPMPGLSSDEKLARLVRATIFEEESSDHCFEIPLFPPLIEKVLSKMVHVNPVNRFASMQEVASEIGNVLEASGA